MTLRASRFAIVKIAGLGISVFVALAAVYSAGKSAAQTVSNSPSAKSFAAPAATDRAPAATDKTAPAAGAAADGAAAADPNNSTVLAPKTAHAPQLVAAGTATYVRPAVQDNKRAVRVKLPAEIAAHLGDDYIVLLTNRFPTSGYPFFSAYWRPAADGFDISLVDVEINDGTTASSGNPNTKYLIDWLVIKK